MMTPRGIGFEYGSVTNSRSQLAMSEDSPEGTRKFIFGHHGYGFQQR